ncbi:hypothetical protein CPI31_06320 [Moraxella catarrhalis]|uniref:hypothetical protein n=1 Tax=Moraxella catarrhalis TaxID=480 RepID=UPI00128CF4C2|nr:hypothetical protein [Moraxella catarrhalis]MPX19198.1 hypothetical protein [Moraxella catarrhalis]
MQQLHTQTAPNTQTDKDNIMNNTQALQAIMDKIQKAQDALWNDDDNVFSQLVALSDSPDQNNPYYPLADKINQASNLVRDVQAIIATALENKGV